MLDWNGLGPMGVDSGPDRVLLDLGSLSKEQAFDWQEVGRDNRIHTFKTYTPVLDIFLIIVYRWGN